MILSSISEKFKNIQPRKNLDILIKGECSLPIDNGTVLDNSFCFALVFVDFHPIFSFHQTASDLFCTTNEQVKKRVF